MEFTGNEGAVISLDLAVEMTSNYRQSMGENDMISFTVGKSTLNQILLQDGCLGLRVYKSLNENLEEDILFVGVDRFGNDMYQGVIIDRVVHCPPTCPDKSPLNSDN